MAKIKSIETFRVRPRWLFLKLTDTTGTAGWGEATLEGHVQAVEGALEQMAARITGYEADDIEHIWQTIYRLGFYRGGPVFMSALSGIDIALWDLKARKLNVPIHQLLGGKVRNKLKVYCWIGGDRPSDIEAAAKARKAQGLTAVKMNATEEVGWLDSPSVLDAAVERLKIVKSLGMDAAIDFHGRLHKPMAKQLAKALEPHRPLFIEEPLLSEHPAALSHLSTLTTTPIATGERLHSRFAVLPFLSPNPTIDIIQADVAHCGGISELRRIATLAEAHDVAVAPHCPLGPIALAACMQVDLVSANFAIQEMSLGMHYNSEMGEADLGTYVRDPGVFEIEGGYVRALEGNGLGVEVDEEAVRAEAGREGGELWVCKGFWGEDGGVMEW